MKNFKGEDIDEFVIDNLNLLYWLVHKLNNGNSANDDDVIGYCMDRYLNACINYDETKNMKFSSYLSKTVHHSLICYYTRNKQYLAKKYEIQSLDNLLTDHDDIKKVYGIEIAKYDDFERFSTAENQILINSVFEYLDNNFTDIEISIFMDYLKGNRQTDIGDKYGYTQVSISRIVAKIQRKLKKEFNPQFDF